MTETLNILCDYCQQPARLVGGETIYPHRSDLYARKFYHCAPCGAWVGCHRGTAKPLGRLANAELRRAKQEAHTVFDELWRRTTPAGSFDREGDYKWLAKRLEIERGQCHIGLFDVETCRRVVEICNRRIQMNNNPTNEHREQAREIAEIQNRAQEKYGNVRMGEPLEEPCPGCGCVTFAAARKDVNTLLAALSSRDTEVREVLEGLLPFVQKVAALTCSRTMGAEGDVCGFYERDVKDFCAACHAETLLTDDGLQRRTALNQPSEKSLPGE